MKFKGLGNRLCKVEATSNDQSSYPADIRDWTDQQIVTRFGNEWVAQLGLNQETPLVEFTDQQLETIAKGITTQW